jgi:hypothetical protein
MLRWILVSNKSEVKQKHFTLSIMDKMKVLDKLDASIWMAKITEEFDTGKQTVSEIR